MYTKILLFLMVIGMLATPIFANDAVEAAATDNIQFEQTPELVMQSETLIITKASGKSLTDDKISISVDFDIKNNSNKDITRKIAFVLPPVQCADDENTTWTGLKYNKEEITDNPLQDFKTFVDGKAQSYSIRTEAYLGKKNITDLLHQLKIPLNPCRLQTTSEGQPDPRYSENLKKHHLLTDNNSPAWKENIYFEWQQNFPAKKIVHLHHEYTPASGAAVLSLRTKEELNDHFRLNVPPMLPIWSADLTTLQSWTPIIFTSHSDLYKDNQTRYCVMPQWVRYHLTTGSYWKNGIGNFNLIIKDRSGAPFALNTFYNKNDAVQIKTIKNGKSFIIKKFIPTKNLLVLFLSLPRNQDELKSCFS